MLDFTAARIQSVLENHKGAIYETHTWKDNVLIPGIRGLERRDLINRDDLSGKMVLDVGCGTGALSTWAMECGALEVMGLDDDEMNIDTFKGIAHAAGDYFPDIFWRLCDLSNGLPEDILDLQFDTMFCFSASKRLGYRKIWADVPSIRVAYVEGDTDSPYIEKVLRGGGFSSTLIGFVPINKSKNALQRPIFRLEKHWP